MKGKQSPIKRSQLVVSKEWKRLKTRVLLQHPRITIVEDDVKLPKGNVIKYLRFSAKGDGVTVICLKDGHVLLQREYSYPVNEALYQFPGGKVEPGESPRNAAIRELIEESGLEPRVVEQLGWYYVDNRRTSSKMYVLLARDFVKTYRKKRDKEELIESRWVSIERFKKMITDGRIVNYSVLAAWILLQNRREYTENLLGPG